MVAYLNIPLSRNIKTNRHHSRRVVWLFLLTGIVGILISWRIVDVFCMRDTVSKAAPEQTVAMIRFHPSQKTWNELLYFFDQTPLISNRPLTLKDVQPFVKGEFAIFFDEQGRKSLAIEASENDLPKDIFDKLGISIQKINHHLFLLSETLMPTGNNQKRVQKKSSFLSLGTIGTFSLKLQEDQWISGPITIKKHEICVTLPNPGIKEGENLSIPETTIAALSIQGLTFLSSEIFSTSINELTGLENNFLNVLTDNTDASLKIILVKDDTSTGFQYLLSTETTKNKEEIIRFLKQVVALNQPTVEIWNLMDGSFAYEIMADPSMINYEEINISGTPIVRFSLKNGEEIHFWQKGWVLFLSNSSQLVGEYLNQDSQKKMGVFYLNVKEVLPFLRKQKKISSEYNPMDFLNKISVLDAKINKNGIIFNIK